MSHCKRCRIEFLDEMETCPECGDALLDGAPAEPLAPDVEWVRLASLPHDAEGEMLQEVLTQEGIQSLLKRDVLASAFGTQGTSIFVDVSQLGRAQEIYKQIIGD